MKRTLKLFSLAITGVLIVNLLGIPPIPAYSQSDIDYVALPLPTGWRNGTLYSVWGSSDQNVYAVGVGTTATGQSVPLLYHNDGAGWTEASPALPSGWDYGHLYGVWNSLAGDVYAVGEGNNIVNRALLYHNDGTGWNEAGLSLPAGWSSSTLITIWGISAGDVYAVGWGNGPGGYGHQLPLFYHNNGTGWTMDIPFLPAGWSQGSLHGVWASSSSNIYLVGVGTNAQGLESPLIYHQDGNVWTAVSISLPSGWEGGNLYGVSGSSASDVYATGYGYDTLGKGMPLVYHYDGSGWSEASPLAPTGSGWSVLNGGWTPATGQPYAAGFTYDSLGNSQPLLYQHNDSNWTQIGLSRPDGWRAGYLHSVWGSVSGNMYTVGEGRDAGGTTLPLLYQWMRVPLIHHVKWDATGANDGTSWADAYTDLQSALAAASAGDEIWVTLGTYKPTSGTDRTISFPLKSGVAIYGGFAGNEVERNERNLAGGFTTLSGDIGVVGSDSDNSYHVVTASGTDNTTVLDGFAITAGNANDASNNTIGGGMFSDSGSPSLKNITISNNNASYDGGGMYVGTAAHPSLANVLFSNNTAYNGGAMFNGNSAHPSLTNVTFSSNQAANGGGAVYNYIASPSLTNVTFSNNTATYGGGIYDDGGNPLLTNVTFSGNSANYGGGIANYGDSPLLTNVTFSGNAANYSGGGIFNSWGTPLIRNSIVYGNTNGDIYFYSYPPTVTSSIVQGGYSGSGNMDADPLLTALQGNGGFTQTMALLPDSPAIDAGDDATCPETDQRGIIRPQGSHCDIGAFEYQPPVISPGATIRVSVSSSGEQALDGSSYYSSLSADGHYIVFNSDATNLVADDTNAVTDIFVHDMQTELTSRISVNSAGIQGNGYSYLPSITANGDYVAFTSSATNLVLGDTNGVYDVFVHNLLTGSTSRVSVNSSGLQANDTSYDASFSADGHSVVFTSSAANLISADTNGVTDIFIHDMLTGLTSRLSTDSNGIQANDVSYDPSISADGRYIAFQSSATNLVPGDTNGVADIFLHDMQTGATTRISVSASGEQANGLSAYPFISGGGRYVAFDSLATNLVVGDSNGMSDVFMYDLQTGLVTRVSVDSRGLQANDHSIGPSVSMDGRYVAFHSDAANLVPGDTNGVADIFVHDMQMGKTTRVSVGSNGEQGNDYARGLYISANGRYIVFDSGATNLVSGDTNLQWDVFVHGLDIAITPPTLTPTALPTDTSTPTDTATATQTATSTSTVTATQTSTPTTTATATATATQIPTPTITATSTPIVTQTLIATVTPMLTQTSTPTNEPANVNVYVHGDLQGSYTLEPHGGTRQSYGMNSGPVQILSPNKIPLIGAERVIYKVNKIPTSFSEMMALPNSQLDTTYWLPWYNNKDLDTQLRFGNVDPNEIATVHVKVGGVEVTGCIPHDSPFTLQPGESARVSCAGLNNGPVELLSEGNIPIMAAERVIYRVNNLNTSFSEMMALPDKQLDNSYWLPWYNNVDLDTQLRFGNVDPNLETTVHLFIGGQEMTTQCLPSGPYLLKAGASTRVSCSGLNNGPVQIKSDGGVKIVAAERVIYKVNQVNASFSEMMALPNKQLDTVYWLPWYNNRDLDTQLRIGNISTLPNHTATVHVYIGGQEVKSGCTAPNSPYTLGPGVSLRISCTGVNSGPVRIESDIPIVAAERVIYKVNNFNTSFSEMMALPNSQLDSTYWLPWYNNVDLDTQLRFAVP